MACDCLDKFNEQLRPHNVAVESQTIRSRFDGKPDVVTERVKLATYKVQHSPKRKELVFPSHCPFCGSPYIEPEVVTPAEGRS